MAWVKCTAYNEDRTIYLNLDNVISLSHGSSWTTVMFSVGYGDNSEAGMMLVRETPDEILGRAGVHNA